MTAPSYQYPPSYRYLSPYSYPPPRRRAAPTVASLALIGFAMLGIVGSFMPWATAAAIFVGQINVAGTSSPAGWITIFLCLVLGLTGGLSLIPGGVWRVVMFAVALILGLAIAAWAVFALTTMLGELTTASESGVLASVGPGPVVVLIAGMGTAFAAIFGVVIGSRTLASSRSPSPFWPTNYPA